MPGAPAAYQVAMRTTGILLTGLLACAAQPAAAQVLLTIDRPSGDPIALTAADLAAMPRSTAARDDHGRRIACEGVALTALLARAGLPSGNDVRGPALTTLVVATARDDYRVAFTLGELDPALGNTAALVADRCDGQPLDAQAGPLRLIVPDDRRGARSVRQLHRLTAVEPFGR